MKLVTHIRGPRGAACRTTTHSLRASVIVSLAEFSTAANPCSRCAKRYPKLAAMVERSAKSKAGELAGNPPGKQPVIECCGCGRFRFAAPKTTPDELDSCVQCNTEGAKDRVWDSFKHEYSEIESQHANANAEGFDDDDTDGLPSRAWVGVSRHPGSGGTCPLR